MLREKASAVAAAFRPHPYGPFESDTSYIEQTCHLYPPEDGESAEAYCMRIHEKLGEQADRYAELDDTFRTKLQHTVSDGRDDISFLFMRVSGAVGSSLAIATQAEPLGLPVGVPGGMVGLYIASRGVPGSAESLIEYYASLDEQAERYASAQETLEEQGVAAVPDEIDRRHRHPLGFSRLNVYVDDGIWVRETPKTWRDTACSVVTYLNGDDGAGTETVDDLLSAEYDPLELPHAVAEGYSTPDATMQDERLAEGFAEGAWAEYDCDQ